MRKNINNTRFIAFWLTHIGLLFVLIFACLGTFELQKLHIRLYAEIPENTAYDEDLSMFEIPFQITLKNFTTEFYDNHQPKSYKAEIVLKADDSGKRTILEVNHPARFIGYDVYLASYDQTKPNNPDYVMLLVVYDPYVWAKYFSIIMFLLGLFLNIWNLPYSKNRAVAWFVLLFGLGFSLMPFGKYLFGGKHLAPALQSVWFVPHIAVYMFAYGALTVACLLSLVGAYRIRPMNKKYIIKGVCNTPLRWRLLNDDFQKAAVDFSLRLGVSLMGIGLFFGSLWAKTAWGRFWGFDLKETWAAIAWVAFLGVLHFNRRCPNRRKLLSILIIIAFLLLQMCWFGVNYLPAFWQSLHRY